MALLVLMHASEVQERFALKWQVTTAPWSLLVCHDILFLGNFGCNNSGPNTWSDIWLKATVLEEVILDEVLRGVDVVSDFRDVESGWSYLFYFGFYPGCQPLLPLSLNEGSIRLWKFICSILSHFSIKLCAWFQHATLGLNHLSSCWSPWRNRGLLALREVLNSELHLLYAGSLNGLNSWDASWLRQTHNLFVCFLYMYRWHTVSIED